MSRTAVTLYLCTFLSSATLTPVALYAQHTQPAPAPAGPGQAFTANPFLLILKDFNLEYERRHLGSTTFGVSTSGIGVGDAEYRNLQGFYRYYPQGLSLSGFYVGGRGGLHRVSVDDKSGTFLGVGFELGYTWLLGSQRNFSVSIGAGATRLFGGDLNDVSLVVPTVRLVNLGWAF